MVKTKNTVSTQHKIGKFANQKIGDFVQTKLGGY